MSMIGTVVGLYSIYDSKSELYNFPFMCPNAGSARRMFSMNVNEPRTMINSHAEDFVLFHVGDFNGETGEIVPCVPKSVCNGLDVKEVV